jgi:hypothetical protein
MPLPELSDAQVTWVAGEVAKYIEQQRNRYGRTAAPLSGTQKALLRPFFVDAVLDSARLVVLKDSQVENPPFYSQLEAMGFDKNLLPDFADMGAVTFVDVIVSNGPISTATLFHELVHVVQYGKLGLSDFAARYVTGFLRGGSYERIPLEINAYQLDAEYTRNPKHQFPVEERVQAWIDGDRF